MSCNTLILCLMDLMLMIMSVFGETGQGHLRFLLKNHQDWVTSSLSIELDCFHPLGQDLLLTAGIPGLFPNVLPMGKGNLLEAGALGPLIGTHILTATLFSFTALSITPSLQEEGAGSSKGQ